MGCCSECAKAFLFIINFVILTSAIALITFGVIYIIHSPVWTISTFTVIVGVIIALIAFFGCYGAWKENICLLGTYAVILLVLFCVQIAFGIFIFISIENTDGQLTTIVVDFLNTLYRDYGTTSENTDILDEFQRNFECCGIYGNSTTSDAWYASCCPVSVQTCTSAEAFTIGCSVKLLQWMDKYGKIIGGIVFGFVIFELIAAGLASLIAILKKRSSSYINSLKRF